MQLTEREKKIYNLIKKEKFISNQSLRKVLFISESTLRRDLIKLENKGIINRVHGGAVLAESSSIESSFQIRISQMMTEKNNISLKALDFISNNESYFFDPSTTVSYLTPHLDNFKNITVITNGILTANLLSKNANPNIILLGGKLSKNVSSLLGSTVIKQIEEYNCNAFFFSCGGISDNGLITEANYEQSVVKQAMLKNSKVHILLADSTKFGKVNLVNYCTLEELDYIITEKLPNKHFLELLNKYKVNLIIANNF